MKTLFLTYRVVAATATALILLTGICVPATILDQVVKEPATGTQNSATRAGNESSWLISFEKRL